MTELEIASFLGKDCALLLGLQAGDKLRLQSAGLLRVEVAHFLGNIHETVNLLFVAFFGSLLVHATSPANLDRQFLAGCVPNKLPRRLLNVSGAARRFVDGSAFFLALPVANLLLGPVALSDGFLDGLLSECNLTLLLKVLFANFLLGRFEVRDVGVVALLDILVLAL